MVRHARRILALCEAGLPWEVDGQLETLGAFDFGGRLAGPMTAHPKVDAVTGEMILFGYGWAPPFLRYHVADRHGTLRHSVEIAVKGPTMMHDFAVTATRTVLLDLPVVFDVALADRTGVPYRFDAGYGARIGILPRFGVSAEVRWIEIDPCYVFHTLNAYDDGPDRVVLELARYPSMFDWSACWSSCTGRRGMPATSSCSTPTGWRRRRWPRWSCRSASRSGSTGAGSPPRSDGRGEGARRASLSGRSAAPPPRSGGWPRRTPRGAAARSAPPLP